MLKIVEITDRAGQVSDTLTLAYENRRKSRVRVKLDSGEDAGIFLPRGTILRGGDTLMGDDGRIIEIRAAAEPISTAKTDDALVFARACYHLGNRHVALQIGEGVIRYQPDHVLDELVRALGLIVRQEVAPFDPESGAYSHHQTNGHHDH